MLRPRVQSMSSLSVEVGSGCGLTLCYCWSGLLRLVATFLIHLVQHKVDRAKSSDGTLKHGCPQNTWYPDPHGIHCSRQEGANSYNRTCNSVVYPPIHHKTAHRHIAHLQSPLTCSWYRSRNRAVQRKYPLESKTTIAARFRPSYLRVEH